MRRLAPYTVFAADSALSCSVCVKGLAVMKKLALSPRRLIRPLLYVLIATIVFWSWSTMFHGTTTDQVTRSGFQSLRYFTVLSNLLMGFASIIAFVWEVLDLAKKRESETPYPIWLKILMLAAVTSVTLTLMTVLLFLGPVFGYVMMFSGVSFYMHLITPLLSILTLAVFTMCEGLRFRSTFIAIVPVALYAVYYVGNILINGVGSGLSSNDWYGFMMWGYAGIPFVVLVMLLAVWLIALGLYFLSARKSRARYGIGFVVLVSVFVFGMLLGAGDQTRRYQRQQEASQLLNRSELEGLGEIEGTIYVTGHKSPDADSVCSAIAYANLLQKLGYDAVPVVLGPINHETEYILQEAGVEAPMLLEDASGLNMILVDHSDLSQTAEGLSDARIISIIDHHGAGTVTTSNAIIYDARPLGASATIIWFQYRSYGVEIDQETARLLIGAILSDTRNFESATTTTADREAVQSLNYLAGIEDLDAFYRELYKASISYEGMSDEEIFFSDYKEYESGGTTYAIGCINVYDEEDAREMVTRMKDIVPSALSKTGMDLAFAMINIFHDGLSITFIVPSDETAADVIQSAFPDTASFDGTCFRFEPGMARKQVLVPAINSVLDTYPRE